MVDSRVAQSRRLAPGVWKRASKCSTSECVEVSRRGTDVLMRSSLDASVVLRWSADDWQVFIDGIRGGEFRLP
jgi:hypothetical protein